MARCNRHSFLLLMRKRNFDTGCNLRHLRTSGNYTACCIQNNEILPGHASCCFVCCTRPTSGSLVYSPLGWSASAQLLGTYLLLFIHSVMRLSAQCIQLTCATAVARSCVCQVLHAMELVLHALYTMFEHHTCLA